MKFLTVLLLSMLLVALCCLRCVNPQAELRIIGGQTTRISQEPYMVYLRENGRFVCGGSLVSRRHVVTAAHCVVGLRAGQITVTGGTSSLIRRGVKRSVRGIYLPRQFSMRTMNMDVAVIKLRSPMRGRVISPIGLCSSNLRAGEVARVYGWGVTKESGASVSQQIRSASIRILRKNNCARLYRGRMQLTRSMLCADVPGRTDTCRGDSGGPLVYNGQLCGIVSWGIGCGRRNSPGVYTNIRAVRGFIRRAIRR